jgi:hypothetical protein
VGRQGNYWEVSFRDHDSYRPDRQQQEQAHGDRVCARGQWCASASRAERDDGTWGREPASCTGVFCAVDEAIIGGCLEAFPALHGRLAGAALERLSAEVLVRLPFGPGVPVRVDVDELMRLLVDVACSWHERVATARKLAPPDTQRTRARQLTAGAGTLLDDAVPVLAAYLDDLLALPPGPVTRPWPSLLAVVVPDAIVLGAAGDTATLGLCGADAGNEVMRLEYAGRAVLGETDPAPEVLHGVTCRSCERRSLRRAAPPQHDGDPAYASECTRCGHLMTAGEYRQWTSMNARYWRERVTPAQLAARAGTPVRDAARLLNAVSA